MANLLTDTGMTDHGYNLLTKHPIIGPLIYIGFGIFLSFFVRSGLENEYIKQHAQQQVNEAHALIPKGTHSKVEEPVTVKPE